jgi:hypothetical protein
VKCPITKDELSVRFVLLNVEADSIARWKLSGFMGGNATLGYVQNIVLHVLIWRLYGIYAHFCITFGIYALF